MHTVQIILVEIEDEETDSPQVSLRVFFRTLLKMEGSGSTGTAA